MVNTLLATLIIHAFAAVVVVSAANDTNLFAKSHWTHREELLEEYGKFMLSTMNLSVDPCENFYEYACGNWKESPLLRPEQRNTSLLQGIQTVIDDQVLQFLQNATELPRNLTTSSEWKAKEFYASCVQMKSDLSPGYHKFMELEDRYQKSNFTQDWIYVNFMSVYEIFPLLPLKVNYNPALRKFIVLLQAPIKLLSKYTQDHLQNMTKDFHIEDEVKRREFLDNFANLTQFEKNLTQLVKTRNETEKLTLGEFLLKHKEDRLNWTRYFEVAFNGTQQSHWMVHNQLESVGDLVHFLEHQNLTLLRSYVKQRVLLKFYDVWKTQSSRNSSIANSCRMITESYYNYALLPWFIERVFDKDRRADVLQLALQIRDTFYELLEQYTWLDEETRSQAKTKLSSMDVFVGYSDDLQHRELIDEAYKEVNMTQDFFENIADLERNRARVRLRSVDKALIPQLMPTRTVNAYYADFLNQAFITIGMSQWPLYHIQLPDVVKFAGIGNIVGHEMAHGFDSYCYQFNYDGKKINWWSAGSLRNFKERYRCLESQYNKYLLLGMATNGTLTSGDNIADNVGARMAYYAYKKHTKNKAWQEKPLRGIEYNNKQLFFLKFAQTWCTGSDNAYKLKRLKTDAHASEEFRVVGTLSNMPEFSEAFNCKLGTDMNPLKKCVVW
ncbi:PREDICTED: endothelin-converting enzyme 1 [Drosophila arizonae]|uniref:Endothelin-converting enzyme 1 n=1 Tax=Drosophila arizonae TaxID=7263 RepID=A0ABM1NSL5_DROAR|nr:PREDICTED: endothelin-converting enzyme 1 [Drosophila arizonae]